jgi:hypothetical protein
MPAATTFRTSTQVAQMRALAQERMDDSPFGQAYEGGVIDTLDWLSGVGAAPNVGPASGYPHAAADEDAIATERLASCDLEHEVRGTPASWRPGAVAVTIAWFLGMREQSPA